jgi:hypothetical protein
MDRNSRNDRQETGTTGFPGSNMKGRRQEHYSILLRPPNLLEIGDCGYIKIWQAGIGKIRFNHVLSFTISESL